MCFVQGVVALTVLESLSFSNVIFYCQFYDLIIETLFWFLLPLPCPCCPLH